MSDLVPHSEFVDPDAVYKRLNRAGWELFLRDNSILCLLLNYEGAAYSLFPVYAELKDGTFAAVEGSLGGRFIVESYVSWGQATIWAHDNARNILRKRMMLCAALAIAAACLYIYYPFNASDYEVGNPPDIGRIIGLIVFLSPCLLAAILVRKGIQYPHDKNVLKSIRESAPSTETVDTRNQDPLGSKKKRRVI